LDVGRSIAQAYERMGNKVGAATDFDEAASLGQNVAFVFVQRGNALLEHHKWDDAIVAFDEAVRRARLPTGDAWTLGAALLGRALAYEGADNKVGAATDFDEAASLGQNVASMFVKRSNDFLKDKKYDDASVAFDEAVRRARLPTGDGWTLGAALLGRALAYEGTGNKVGAATDFDEAASLGQNVASVFVERGNGFLNRRKYDEALVAFDEAIRWAERPDAARETLGDSIFGRGRAEDAKLQYEEAIRDFQTATTFGTSGANNWRWWATNRLADQKRDKGLPIDALLIALPNYLDLTQELLLDADNRKSWLSSVYDPLAQLNALRSKEPEVNTQPMDCDHLASHPHDPLRVADSVDFDKLDGASVITACTAAIGSAAAPSRHYFERARGHARAAADARKQNDESQRAQHQAAALADLRIAAEEGYPIAFNNLALAYQNGEGVEEDGHKAADFYLETFNRIVACCAVRVAQHILEVEDQYDAPTVRRVVRALLERAAALGVPQAHEMLGDFYVTGKLTLTAPDTEASIEAYLHRKLAAILFRDNGASQDADRLDGRAAEVRTSLTANQVQIADARIANWKKGTFDSSPPWLSR
jgi:tetratricopeptide (TPR) repeat protein